MPNQTAAEFNTGDRLSSFDSDGFSVGDNDAVNKNTDAILSWNWLAGTAPTADNSAGAGATPTAGSVKIDGSNLGSALAGSIAATRLSANTTNGFSIVKYTGDSGSSQTIAHGLSVAPELIIIKNLTDVVFWPAGTIFGSGWDYYLNFDSSEPQQDNDYFNDTPPTSSVFSVSTNNAVNGNTNELVAYCFHSVEGYSKVGEYAGNGSGSADSNPWWPEGPFVYTGFTPEFLIIKQMSTVNEGWSAWDGTREPYNTVDLQIATDGNRAEYTANALTFAVDFLSNGFKIDTAYSSMNKDGKSYLYYAVAKSPFKYSNAR